MVCLSLNSSSKNRWVMDLRQLGYFLQVAKTLNLTQASGKVWVSQSALSRQIKLLEDELGVVLFERQARGLALTEAGNVLVRRAQLLLDQAQELKQEVSATKLEPTGTLRIGSPTSLRSLLLVPFFRRYNQLYPQVLLVHKQGTAKGMRDALAQGDLDIAITSSQELLEPFLIEPLVSESLCWVGPTSAGLRLDRSISVKSLAGQPLILTSYPNSLRVIFDRTLNQHDKQTQPIIEADSAQMILDLVHSELGYSILPFSGVQSEAQQGYVSACPIRSLRIEWVLARSRERILSEANRCAAVLLMDLCKLTVESSVWGTAKLS
jgi:LysR family transcriptional regulator, nitrogen assimilation regulatory protein